MEKLEIILTVIIASTTCTALIKWYYFNVRSEFYKDTNNPVTTKRIQFVEHVVKPIRFNTIFRVHDYGVGMREAAMEKSAVESEARSFLQSAELLRMLKVECISDKSYHHHLPPYTKEYEISILAIKPE